MNESITLRCSCPDCKARDKDPKARTFSAISRETKELLGPEVNVKEGRGSVGSGEAKDTWSTTFCQEVVKQYEDVHRTLRLNSTEKAELALAKALLSNVKAKSEQPELTTWETETDRDHNKRLKVNAEGVLKTYFRFMPKGFKRWEPADKEKIEYTIASAEWLWVLLGLAHHSKVVDGVNSQKAKADLYRYNGNKAEHETQYEHSEWCVWWAPWWTEQWAAQFSAIHVHVSTQSEREQEAKDNESHLVTDYTTGREVHALPSRIRHEKREEVVSERAAVMELLRVWRFRDWAKEMETKASAVKERWKEEVKKKVEEAEKTLEDAPVLNTWVPLDKSVLLASTQGWGTLETAKSSNHKLKCKDKKTLFRGCGSVNLTSDCQDSEGYYCCPDCGGAMGGIVQDKSARRWCESDRGELPSTRRILARGRDTMMDWPETNLIRLPSLSWGWAVRGDYFVERCAVQVKKDFSLGSRTVLETTPAIQGVTQEYRKVCNLSMSAPAAGGSVTYHVMDGYGDRQDAIERRPYAGHLYRDETCTADTLYPKEAEVRVPLANQLKEQRRLCEADHARHAAERKEQDLYNEAKRKDNETHKEEDIAAFREWREHYVPTTFWEKNYGTFVPGKDVCGKRGCEQPTEPIATDGLYNLGILERNPERGSVVLKGKKGEKGSWRIRVRLFSDDKSHYEHLASTEELGLEKPSWELALAHCVEKALAQEKVRQGQILSKEATDIQALGYRATDKQKEKLATQEERLCEQKNKTLTSMYSWMARAYACHLAMTKVSDAVRVVDLKAVRYLGQGQMSTDFPNSNIVGTPCDPDTYALETYSGQVVDTELGTTEAYNKYVDKTTLREVSQCTMDDDPQYKEQTIRLPNGLFFGSPPSFWESISFVTEEDDAPTIGAQSITKEDVPQYEMAIGDAPPVELSTLRSNREEDDAPPVEEKPEAPVPTKKAKKRRVSGWWNYSGDLKFPSAKELELIRSNFLDAMEAGVFIFEDRYRYEEPFPRSAWRLLEDNAAEAAAAEKATEALEAVGIV